ICEVEGFIHEALKTFSWMPEALASQEEYRKLSKEHPILADIASFQTAHINHLTPRTLNIGATSTICKASAAQGPEAMDEAMRDAFRAYPDTWSELRTESFDITGTLSLEDLVNQEYLKAEPITYEDFLPFSAAGIFASNLDKSQEEPLQANKHPDPQGFEKALGSVLLEPEALMAATNLQPDTMKSIYPTIDASTTLKQSAKGQVVMITGAGRGIGQAIAIAFAQASAAKLILTALEVSELEGSRQKVLEIKPDIQVFLRDLDVRSNADVDTFVSEAAAWAGNRIDVVCCNAGISPPLVAIASGDPDRWWMGLEVNLKSVYLFSRHVLPIMLAQGAGHIIITVSRTVARSDEKMSSYQISKLTATRLCECILAGACLGQAALGYVTEDVGWRWAFWVTFIACGLNLITMFLWLPETTFQHGLSVGTTAGDLERSEKQRKEPVSMTLGVGDSSTYVRGSSPEPLTSMRPNLWFIRHPQVDYSANWFLYAVRPFSFILAPTVLWASVAYGVAAGGFTSIGVCIPQLLGAPPYNYNSATQGPFSLCSFVGVVLGGTVGTKLVDIVNARIEKRRSEHGQSHKPEERLIMIVVPFFTVTTGLVLYGVAVEHQIPWTGPAFGYGVYLFGFTVLAGITFSYAVDSYLVRSGEVMVFSNTIRALLSFGFAHFAPNFLNPVGAGVAYSVLAAIIWGLLLFAVPVFFFGPKLRDLTNRYV
ncbi:major facilitator superfamily transporter, partial [Fusarium circinatum]